MNRMDFWRIRAKSRVAQYVYTRVVLVFPAVEIVGREAFFHREYGVKFTMLIGIC